MIEALYRFLKSVGYEHPIHAPIVHMPIGLVTGALVFFLIAIIFKRKQLELSARHVSILALVFAFPTILFGVFDWMHFYHAALLPAIKYKMALAAILLVLLVLGIVFGKLVKLRSLTLTVIYALSFLAAVGLGNFGGDLVYGQVSRQASAPSVAAPSAAPAVASTAAPAASSVDAGEVKAGQALFADNCVACHPDGGNSIVASLPVKGSRQLASLAVFTRFLRAPAMPNGGPGDMPAFDPGSLSAAQVKALYVFASTSYRK